MKYSAFVKFMELNLTLPSCTLIAPALEFCYFIYFCLS